MTVLGIIYAEKAGWMDAAATSFSYDAAGRMQAIYEGPIGSANVLWTYSFADYSRRVRRTARHGQYAEAQADGLGRMTSLTTDLAGTIHDNVTSFARNPASQIGSRTISNDAYAWTGHIEVDRPYAANGLNQYTTAGPASFGYDANGNLTADGSSAYVYDVENRLVSASGATSAQLRYDPLGRLYETSGGAAGITRFLYDGDELVAEYNSSGTLLRRYVHGAAVDDPLVQYEGAGFADPRWLMADHQGSIVGISKASTTLGLNSYDPYGIPGAANQGRFQYTGQAWIPELGMYHYKARIYSPTLGRFMQTDPVGYKDQMNLYAYVGNDPVNNVDPTGTSCVASQVDGKTVYSCRIDYVRVQQNGRWVARPPTAQENARFANFNRQYSAAVNKLASGDQNRMVTVAPVQGSQGSFQTTVGQAAAALVSRTFIFAERGMERNEIHGGSRIGSPVLRSGMVAVGVPGLRQAQTYVSPIGLNSSQRDIVHDGGLHSTPQELTGGLLNEDYPLNYINHQRQYNQAACSLLGEPGCD